MGKIPQAVPAQRERWVNQRDRSQPSTTPDTAPWQERSRNLIQKESQVTLIEAGSPPSGQLSPTNPGPTVSFGETVIPRANGSSTLRGSPLFKTELSWGPGTRNHHRPGRWTLTCHSWLECLGQAAPGSSCVENAGLDTGKSTVQVAEDSARSRRRKRGP